MASTQQMTEGRSLPLLLRFALPLLLGNLLQQTYSLVDAAIVGKYLGIDALASVGASSSVIFLIFGFCAGCCGGFAIPVAQAFGARDYSLMRRYVANSLRISLVLSLFLAVATGVLCSSILHWMQTPSSIFTDAYLYLLICFIGIPFSFFYNLLSGIMRALGDSQTPFYFLLFSTVLNIALDLFCILTLRWGVAGAAIATIVSQAISVVLCYVYMQKRFDVLQGTKEEKRWDKRVSLKLLAIGIPMGLQFSITAIGSMMLQGANNALGTVCVAAFTAAIRIKMFFLCVFESLGIAMATYAGQNYGAGKPERVLQGVKTALGLMMCYALFTFVVLITSTELLVQLFVSAQEVEVIEKATFFIHVAAYMFPILGVLCILRYTIQGLGFTNLSMCSGVAEMIARVAVSLWAVPVWGFTAVSFGDSMAWIAADAFLIPAFILIYRKISRSAQRSPIAY